MEREYIVTLKNFEDLDSFYEDMETPGGNLYIPDRAVEVFNRRPISRNTHYMLTDAEAETIKNDPRVLDVELSLEERGISFKPLWTQSSSGWSKNNIVSNTFNNWGLLRCVEGAQRANWGSNGTGNVSGTINVTASGKNVDVVIVDGHINPNHPEYAVNSNGTGGSRVIQYNWFQDRAAVDPSETRDTYQYTPYVDPSYPDNNGNGISDRTEDNDHGAHVAGTVAGNTQGWARDANIYNISPYSTNPTFTGFFIDYIRYWHKNKGINPQTGVKNPTVTNHSYGVAYSVTATSVTIVRYRGVSYSGPFSAAQLQSYGIFNSGGNIIYPLRSTAYENDFIDAINDGIIVIAAAGNEYTKINNFSSSTADDYNNYFYDGTYLHFYNRGTISAASGVICVGAVGSTINETKATFSNCGPRVDLYAPGRYIMSSVNSNVGVTVADSRNPGNYLTKKDGTSMASPQVTGVAACLAEIWPTMKQAQLSSYLKSYAKLNQMTDTAGGPSDLTDLQGSANRFLFFNKERQDSGAVYPKQNFGLRPTTGHVYPRSKIYRYGT